MINSANWIFPLVTDVTEDFISVKKVSNNFELKINIFSVSNDYITDIFLYSIKNGDELKLPLKKNTQTNQDVWQVNVNIENEAMLRPFSYRFKVVTIDNSFFWDAKGIYKYSVSNNTNFKFYYNTSTPAWLDSAIVYHMFVDRFKKVLATQPDELCWGRTPSENVYEFYGGDILGIIDRLDYLQDLGVNTLCLTPIFKSSTNHKYDVEDYYSVDEGLGGDEAFKSLAQACKNKNIKIILDGVFNHVSGRSEWFNRDSLYAANGAYQDINSDYSDFFSFTKHPEQYDAFWGDKYLPKLNYQSSTLRNTVSVNDDSIIKYWMKEPYNIDGWRFDACCMIGKYNGINLNSEILTELYQEAKKGKEDCYILGENPFDPSEVAPYKHLDGITNYSGFYSPLVYWLDNNTDFNALDMDVALKEFRSLVGFQFALSSKNFIGNHDKQRLYTILAGNEEKYLTALAFLFTYPGVPSVYYGEEIGLHNTDAANDSRICMKWDLWTESNNKIFNFTRKLISLYKAYNAIQKGSFRTLSAENNIYIYERFIGDELILVVLNNSGSLLHSVLIETHSLNRLSIRKLYSFLDASLNIAMLSSNVIEISNITAKIPIILTSKL